MKLLVTPSDLEGVPDVLVVELEEGKHAVPFWWSDTADSPEVDSGSTLSHAVRSMLERRRAVKRGRMTGVGCGKGFAGAMAIMLLWGVGLGVAEFGCGWS